MKKSLTHNDGIAAVFGGAILGGGGGGHINQGLAHIKHAFASKSSIELISVDHLADKAYVACVALVGAPSAQHSSVDAAQMIATVRTLERASEIQISALMTNENGPATTVNGWLQAATLGIPIIDAPANGRAHPTGVMGALSLHKIPGYVSVQAYAGGDQDSALTGSITGKLQHTSQAVRQLSILCGGMIAVCRNPVQVSHVRKHAALGAISFAIELGHVFLSEEDPAAKISASVEFLHGKVLDQGVVTDVRLSQENGFDLGYVQIGDCELTFWNEYMTIERASKRLATFPDLIMTFDTKTGQPVVSAELAVGQRLTVISVSRNQIPLSSTMSDIDLLRSIEHRIHKRIVRV